MLYSRRLIYISLPLWWFTFFKWIYLPVHIHSTFQLLLFWHWWNCYSSNHMGWRFCGPILLFCDLLLLIFSPSLIISSPALQLSFPLLFSFHFYQPVFNRRQCSKNHVQFYSYLGVLLHKRASNWWPFRCYSPVESRQWLLCLLYWILFGAGILGTPEFA